MRITTSFLLVSSLLLFTLGCSRRPRVEAITVTDVGFDTTVRACVEVLPFEGLSITGVYAVDRYLVLLNRQDREGMVTLCDTLHYDTLARFISRGRGPNEALHVQFPTQIDRDGSNSSMWISAVPFFMVCVDLARTAESGRVSFRKKLVFNDNPSLFGRCLESDVQYYAGEDTLLLFGIHRDSRDLHENPNRFYYTYDTARDQVVGDTLFVGNYVARGDQQHLLFTSVWERTKSDMSKSVVAYSYMDLVHLVDHHSRKVTILTGDSRISVPQRDNISSPTLCAGIAISEDYIFILGADARINDGNSYFNVYSWDGEPVVQILLSDVLLYPDYDPVSHRMYGVQPESSVVRYDFRAFLP